MRPGDTPYPREISNTSMNHNLCIYCITTFMCIFILSYIGALLTWLIFAIIVLNNSSNSDFNNKCDESNLWIILLVWVIITGISLFIGPNQYRKKDDDDNSNNNIINLSTCAIIGVEVWTGFEIFSSCVVNNLQENNVYYLLNIMFWNIIGSYCLIFVVLIGYCIVICCSNKTNEIDDINVTSPRPSGDVVV